MGNSGATTCPKCGSALSDQGLFGLCLKCLGRFGLAADAGDAAMLRLGDYELLEEIARGGMGVVYRARQLSLNRIVAVKVVLHGPFANPDFVRRFRHEAEVTATLRHPNIVSVYEVGEYDGHHFLSMEYVEGQTLAELVREQPLTANRAASYVKAIAEAVHYAHQHGVLHRDLKPANILLDGLDRPRVSDFGLAKVLGEDAELTAAGQILGTPNYMPPEQAAGDFSKVTAQSDVYSLGSILYHLIAGRPPFQGGTLTELLARVQTAEPLQPRQLNPGIPANLQSICLKCLRKEPERRYASAQTLADDLGRFLDQKPVLARPISVAERLWLWCRRRPTLAFLSLALAVAVLAGLAGIVWEWRRAEFHARGERIQRLAAEANAARIRLNLYAADVNRAAQAIKDGDYGLARSTLDSLRPVAGEPDLRGFEWRYLWNLSRGNQLATLPGHHWIVTCATFSPDGKLVVSGGMGGDVRVWAVATHSCLRAFNPDAFGIWSVAFTPDGQVLMMAGAQGVQFWNTATWQPIKVLPGILAGLSRDGSIVAISESSPFVSEAAGAVTLWDWRKSEKLRTFAQVGRVLALSPDGRRLALAGKDSDILILDSASGALLKTLPTEKPAWSLNFSPDGKKLVFAGWCGQALVWNWQTTFPPRTITVNRLNLWTAAFSPDGATIVTTSSDQTVRFWDASTLAARAVLHGHANEVWCAAFSPDGKMLVTGGKDQKVMLWSTDLQAKPDTLPHDTYSPPLFSPDGNDLATIKPDSDVASQLWNARQRVMLADTIRDGANVVGFSRDSKCVMLFNADEPALEFWTAGGVGPVRRVPLEEPFHRNETYVDPGTSPEQDFFFAAAADGRIYVWNTVSGKLEHTFQAQAPPIRSVVLGPGGRRLALSLEREDIARLYHCATGREFRLVGHKDFVSNLAFSPDGSTVASGSMDGTIRLWNATNGALRAQLPGHMQETTDLAFSPDGQTLASVSNGESLKFWHLPTLREVYSEPMPDAGLWLRFSPDGERLAVGLQGNQLRLLEAPKE
jgi:WD40 repeat protein/predicted Ser/Thr protein kinase